MTITKYPHIEIRADGIPWIEGHETKVVEIVLDRIAYDDNTEEIQRNHPHLSLAEIHSALAYYYDHQGEIDQDISQRDRRAHELFAKDDSSLIRQKLARSKAERLAR